MRRAYLLLIFLVLVFGLFLGRLNSLAVADDLDDINKQIADLTRALEMSKNATEGVKRSLLPLEAQISSVRKKIDSVAAGISEEEAKIKVLEASIVKREDELSGKYEILAARVRRFYIRSYFDTSMAALFSASEAGEIVREFGYRKALQDRDKGVIADLSLKIVTLNKDKDDAATRREKLAGEKVRLAKAQTDFDAQAVPLRKVIKEAEAYQQQVTSQIAQLSVRQQQLLAEKTGTFQTSVGDVPLADDPNSRPDFNPGFSPAFAGFSFGAPHRKGMSQYGAFGRAKGGQSAEDILRAYYGSGAELKKDYSTSISINVQGYGTYNIEDYAKRIYEVPNSWGDNGGYEALKAQAVAARSYALSYTNNGSGSICATESCQVFQPNAKGGNWDRAVNDTKGWVLVANGRPLSSWYASTAGGYTFSYLANGYSTPGEWDTKCGNQGCWTSEAYEKIAGSPWFYKGWYKARDGATCGRSSPWLSNDEFSDILNAIIVSKNDSGGASHIFPIDVNSCFGRSEDVWSREKMRDEASKYGGSVTSVSGVSVSYNTGGLTGTVKFQTNRGELSFSGDEFRTIFNLRASGRLWLASSLFNIEKK